MLGLFIASSQAATTPETQLVEITAALPGARDEKTLAQLLSAQDAFARHRALAPEATLGFRLYARLGRGGPGRLRLVLSTAGRARVPLDDRQRFTLVPQWTRADADRGALLQHQPAGRRGRLEGGRALAGHPRRPPPPGRPAAECEADTFHGNLQRGLRTPVSAIMDASDELCLLDDAEAWFAERPIFGVTLVDGARTAHAALQLPARQHRHDGAGRAVRLAPGRCATAPTSCRWRTRRGPTTPQVVFDAMADPQPEPTP